MFHIKIVEHQCREEEKNLTDGEEKEGQSCLQRAHLLYQWMDHMDGLNVWGGFKYLFVSRPYRIYVGHSFPGKVLFISFKTNVPGLHNNSTWGRFVVLSHQGL